MTASRAPASCGPSAGCWGAASRASRGRCGARRTGNRCTLSAVMKCSERYFLVDFYAPATAVESIMEHLSRDIDVIRPTVVKHPLTQEAKACEGLAPVPLEERLYSTKKRK
uniref:Small ribosomal subunit protein bS6m n=1 Tax=Molossus molossus TaxID=27622 RepID=A0A7J8I2F9_MOLMO|nr:mitochondrial ribosomal protein S6 [Molossus molossus]